MSSYGLDVFRTEIRETDDSGDLQKLKKILGYADEEITDAHRVSPFGFSSHAPVGSHGIAVAARGQRDLVAVLGAEHAPSRPKNLTAGQAALYDDKGNIIRMFGDGGMHIFGKKQDMTIESDKDNIFVKIDAGGGKKIYLGGNPSEGGTFAKVATESGYSPFVYARIA